MRVFLSLVIVVVLQASCHTRPAAADSSVASPIDVFPTLSWVPPAQRQDVAALSENNARLAQVIDRCDVAYELHKRREGNGPRLNRAAEPTRRVPASSIAAAMEDFDAATQLRNEAAALIERAIEREITGTEKMEEGCRLLNPRLGPINTPNLDAMKRGKGAFEKGEGQPTLRRVRRHATAAAPPSYAGSVNSTDLATYGTATSVDYVSASSTALRVPDGGGSVPGRVPRITEEPVGGMPERRLLTPSCGWALFQSKDSAGGGDWTFFQSKEGGEKEILLKADCTMDGEVGIGSGEKIVIRSVGGHWTLKAASNKRHFHVHGGGTLDITNTTLRDGDHRASRFRRFFMHRKESRLPHMHFFHTRLVRFLCMHWLTAFWHPRPVLCACRIMVAL